MIAPLSRIAVVACAVSAGLVIELPRWLLATPGREAKWHHGATCGTAPERGRLVPASPTPHPCRPAPPPAGHARLSLLSLCARSRRVRAARPTPGRTRTRELAARELPRVLPRRVQ